MKSNQLYLELSQPWGALRYFSLKKAQSLGKGYTSVLSRILENALNDNDLIKRYL